MEDILMLSCSDSGRGETVILLHGIPGSRRSWDAVLPLLPDHRVIVPDLLGFGTSGDAAAGMHAADHARAVLELMDRMRVEIAHVVGFDFGGPVAVALHALAPGRISRLTLMATNVLAGTPLPIPLRLAKVPLAGELFFRALFSPAGIIGMALAAAGNRRTFPLRAFRGSIDARGRRTASAIFLHSLRRLSDLYTPIETELARIAVPVSVVWGDRDPFFPLSVGRQAASACGGTLHVLEGCGHWLPYERPAQVAHLIVAGNAAAERRPELPHHS